jgi:hypothetical protein
MKIRMKGVRWKGHVEHMRQKKEFKITGGKCK